MSTLTLQPISQLVNNASSLVSDTGMLNSFFYAVHTVHKWWKWKQDAELIYTYYQQPALALGDIGAYYLGEDKLIFTVTAIALAVIRSLWQAELERLALNRTWRELKWHSKHRSFVPFQPQLLKPGFSTTLRKTAFKTRILFKLLTQVVYGCLALSMHLLDIYQSFSNKEQQERLKMRFISNGVYLHQQLPTIIGYLKGPSELPFCRKVNLQPEYLTRVDDLCANMVQLKAYSIDASAGFIEAQRLFAKPKTTA